MNHNTPTHKPTHKPTHTHGFYICSQIFVIHGFGCNKSDRWTEPNALRILTWLLERRTETSRKGSCDCFSGPRPSLGTLLFFFHQCIGRIDVDSRWTARRSGPTTDGKCAVFLFSKEQMHCPVVAYPLSTPQRIVTIQPDETKRSLHLHRMKSTIYDEFTRLFLSHWRRDNARAKLSPRGTSDPPPAQFCRMWCGGRYRYQPI